MLSLLLSIVFMSSGMGTITIYVLPNIFKEIKRFLQSAVYDKFAIVLLVFEVWKFYLPLGMGPHQ